MSLQTREDCRVFNKSAQNNTTKGETTNQQHKCNQLKPTYT